MARTKLNLNFEKFSVESDPELYGINLNGGNHPLFNSLILSLIFEHFPTPCTWSKLRLVSKPWNNVLLNQFREISTVHLSSFIYCPKEFIRIQNHFTTLYDNIFAHGDPYQFQKHPFRRLAFHAGVVLKNLCPRQESFLAYIGHNLKYLHLSKVIITPPELELLLFKYTPNLEEFEYTECTVEISGLEEFSYEEDPEVYDVSSSDEDTPENIASVVYSHELDAPVEKAIQVDSRQGTPEWDKVQPNLKKVAICMQSGMPKVKRLQFPISWMDFFSHFPNIQSLKIEGFSQPTANETFETILTTIVAIREGNDNKVLNFVDLEIKNFAYSYIYNKGYTLVPHPRNAPPAAVTVAMVPILTTLLSNVRKLTLLISDLGGEELSQIMRSCPNLVTLEMERHTALSPYDDFDYSTFPPSLQHLDMTGHIMESWIFLRCTPNITSLKILITNIRGYIQYPEENAEMFQVEKLKVFYYLAYYPPVEGEVNMFYFTRIMPNLTRIAIRMDQEDFLLVCSYWRDLEEIKLFKKQTICPNFIANQLRSLCKLKTVAITDNYDASSLDWFTTDNIRDCFLQMESLTTVKGNFIQGDDPEAFRLLEAKLEDSEGCYIQVRLNQDPRLYATTHFQYLELAKYLYYVYEEELTREKIEERVTTDFQKYTPSYSHAVFVRI